MAYARGVLVFVLIAAGLVFVGQGLGIIRGRSFMVDDIRWTWIGASLVAVGIAIAVVERRSRRRS